MSAGCTRQDPLDAYFSEVDAIVTSMRSESIAATPRGRAVTPAGVGGVNEARRAAADRLDAMDPPPEVAPEHLALVAALTDLVGAVDVFLGEQAGADPEAFEAAVDGAVSIAGLAERVATACSTIDRRAAELGIDADIRC